MALTKVAPAGIGSTPGDGYRIGSSFLHSTGVELTNANASGIVTAAQFDGKLNIGIATFTDDVKFTGDAANVTWDKSTDDLKFDTNAKAVFGTNSDLSIYHSSNVNHIKGANSRNIYIQGDDVAILNGAGNQTGLWANSGGSIDLFYANVKKFSTSGIGATVTGQLDVGNVNSTGVITATKFVGDIAVGSSITYADNEKAYFGTGLDLEIYHSGTKSIINDAGTGSLELQVGGTTKLATYSDGVAISGNATSGILRFNDTDGNVNYQIAGYDGNRMVIMDGTGGTVLDLREDGTNIFSKNSLRFDVDNLEVSFGGGTDFKILHTGSANVFDASTSNPFSFKFGGTEKASFNSSGVFNINNGSGQSHYQITQASGNTIKMGIVSGSDFEISGSANNNIIFKRAGSTRLTVTSDGATVAPNLTANSVLSSYGGVQTKLGFISGGAEGFVGTISNHALFIKTADTNRIKIANNSAATSIGGAMTYNAMLTVQGDISSALLSLKAAENTNRFVVSGSDTASCEVNLYDNNGTQQLVLGTSTGAAWISQTQNNYLQFKTNNTERVRIWADGGTQLTRRTNGGTEAIGNDGGKWFKIGTWAGSTVDAAARATITVLGANTHNSNANVSGETKIHLAFSSNPTLYGYFYSTTAGYQGIAGVAHKYDSSAKSAEIWVKYEGGYGSTACFADVTNGFFTGDNTNTGSTSTPSGATLLGSEWTLWTSDGSNSKKRLQLTADGKLKFNAKNSYITTDGTDEHIKIETEGKEAVRITQSQVLSTAKHETKVLQFSCLNSRYWNDQSVKKFYFNYYTGASSATYHVCRMISQTDWGFDNIEFKVAQYQYSYQSNDLFTLRFRTYYGGHIKEITQYNQQGSGTGTGSKGCLDWRQDFGPGGSHQIHQSANGGYFRDCWGSDVYMSLGVYEGFRLEVTVWASTGLWDTGDYANAQAFYPAAFQGQASQSDANSWNGPRGVWFNTTSNGTGTGSNPGVFKFTTGANYGQVSAT